MSDFYVAVGQSVTFSKTVTETDVVLFAGISGDFAPVHVNQQIMETSVFGQRIAHGALITSFMSTLSTLMVAQAQNAHRQDETPVSLGYDRIRFTAPVFFGDTITLTYTIVTIDPERRRSTAAIEAKNQRDDIVAVATHILKWVGKAA